MPVPSKKSVCWCSVGHPQVFQENRDPENAQPDMEKGNSLLHSQVGHLLFSQESDTSDKDKHIDKIICCYQSSKISQVV
jgi:hypothetical protein